MTASLDDRRALEELDFRLRTLLPEEYQDSYEEVQPTSMGSAGLKYDADGKVAWNEIWGSFCDLAMAGGPPHKGKLLEPGTRADIEAQPERYQQVVDEICRGVEMVTELPAQPAPAPGWIRVDCLTKGMAAWLARAIVMENVAARYEANFLDLPVAPHFRLEKEIKNVVTVIAKTCHYWLGHMPRTQQRAIANFFTMMAERAPLVEPALASDGTAAAERETVSARMAQAIREATGLSRSNHRYDGWFGVECPSVQAAIWMMRALVVSNVLSRREETVLFVPINPQSDPGGDTVASAVAHVHRLAIARGVV